MVRCIVKCCKNSKETCTVKQVSFFKLPENPIMREGWLQKIEVQLPSNIKNARICSAHFTEDSFFKGKRNRADGSNIRRRNLIPSAVPTLLLSPMEISIDNTVPMDYKVIYKDFTLPVKTSMEEASGSVEVNSGNESIERPLQNDNAGGSSSAPVNMNDMKASEHVSSSQLLDEICRTPPSASAYNACDYVEGATFPTRSQRKRNIVCRNILHPTKTPSRTASKRRSEVAEIEECASNENSPSWKRKQR